MLKPEYSNRFLKELTRLKKQSTVYDEIVKICFDNTSNYKQKNDITKLEKITGYKNYYRIKVRDFRIGLKIENDILYFMRVLHRKDIYKYFP